MKVCMANAETTRHVLADTMVQASSIQCVNVTSASGFLTQGTDAAA